MWLLKDSMCNDVPELVEHNDDKEVKVCFVCDEVIELHSSYYTFRDSTFNHLKNCHKFCGQLPKQISHPLHPQHLLIIDDYRFSYYPCDFCNKIVDTSTHMYGCKDNCHFRLHLLCGADATFKLLLSKTTDERERMTLKDLNHHHHHLMLINIPSPSTDDEDEDEEDKDNKEDVAIIQTCNACRQPILDSSYYACTLHSQGCNDYFLHRFCGDLPFEMKHQLHPLHSLMLMLSPPLNHFKCFACGNFCEAPIYSCRKCSFQLHIACATTKSRLLEHECHQHPLTLLPSSTSSSFCNACRRVHEGTFYQCTTCVVFLIHQDCASLGYIIYHKSHQGHPLRLRYHIDISKGIRTKCDICYHMIHEQAGWFYHCWGCKFYAHLRCIQIEIDQEPQDIDPNIPRLPWEEVDNEFGTVGLLNRNLESTENDDNGSKMDYINHFSHPDHPLILHNELPKEANPYSIGEIALTTKCNGCCKQISAPLYCCVDCNFYIHKSCALLPTSSVQSHIHSARHAQCSLFLLREPWYETRVFTCMGCGMDSNGFCYQCEEESCNYKIDVECAFLPRKIVHKAHPFHTLSLLIQTSGCPEGFRYKCCDDDDAEYRYDEKYTFGYKYAYRCDIDTCKFIIHAKCAMYPAKAHHRFDSESPFMLSFNPSNLVPTEYHYCDICEKILDPKKWYYFSSMMGGQVMHSHCILNGNEIAVEHPNFKSVSSLLELDNNHPHLLHLYPILWYRHCSKCGIWGKDDREDCLAYQCVEWTCTYVICDFCVELEENTQGSVDTELLQLYLERNGSTRRAENVQIVTTSSTSFLCRSNLCSRSRLYGDGCSSCMERTKGMSFKFRENK